MEPWLLEKLFALLVLLVLSGFFSGSETALFSLSRIKREAMQSRGDAADRAVLRMISNPRRLMVTLILWNELVNVAFSTLMAGLGENAMHRLGMHRQAIITVVTTVVAVPLL